MDIGGIFGHLKEIAHRVDAATPKDVKPAGEVRPSTPMKWAVVALIGNLVAVYGLAVFIAMQVFDSIVFNHPQEIVLAQIANQRTIAIAVFVLLGIDTLAIVYAATKVAFSGNVDLTGVSFRMGGDGDDRDDRRRPHKAVEQPPPPVAVVTVTAPQDSGMAVQPPVAAPTPAPAPVDPAPAPVPTDAEMEFEPEPAAIPLKGYPTEYGD